MYEKKYECSIENYICDNYSICREERQYAVFLYNILKYYGKPERRNNKDNVKKIFEACGLGDTETITQVFYEATFMRDFFERNRRLVLGKDHDNLMLQSTFSPSSCKIDDPDKSKSFNHSLVKYVYDHYGEYASPNDDIPYPDKEHHLGHLKLPPKGSEKYERFSTIKYMMNAKPDIAIIYENTKHELFLLFLECKFGSGVDLYDNGQTQLQIQWMIADFLCNHYLKDKKIKVDTKMEDNKKSCLVQFARKSDKPEVILIEDLISLNNDIFK